MASNALPETPTRVVLNAWPPAHPPCNCSDELRLCWTSLPIRMVEGQLPDRISEFKEIPETPHQDKTQNKLALILARIHELLYQASSSPA
jgi:hypothetical protein